MVETSGDRICQVCIRAFAQNTCPKCRCRYCSLSCYKQHSHGCTEAFYREQAVTELRGIRADDADKRKVLQILQRFHDDVASNSNGLTDGEDEEEAQDEEAEDEEEAASSGEEEEEGLGSILSEQTVLAILRKVSGSQSPLHHAPHNVDHSIMPLTCDRGHGGAMRCRSRLTGAAGS